MPSVIYYNYDGLLTVHWDISLHSRFYLYSRAYDYILNHLYVRNVSSSTCGQL